MEILPKEIQSSCTSTKSVPLSCGCRTEINEITMLPSQDELSKPISELWFLPQHSPPPSQTSSSWPSGAPGGASLGLLTFFWSRLLTSQHLANWEGGAVKKNTLYSAWISRQSKYGLLNYSRTCLLEWIVTNSHFFPVFFDELLLLLISFSPLLNRTNLCFNVKFWNTPSQLKDSPSVSLALPRSHSCRQQRADSFPENIE